ncbi:MAG TPA: hypothetical protein VFZ08_08130 [Terriglobia bacterium]|nr:hypothetical protein [Terriglobia bacterium]
MGMELDEELISQLGLNYQVLDSGCCGMAGNFGFQPQCRERMTAIECLMEPLV